LHGILHDQTLPTYPAQKKLKKCYNYKEVKATLGAEMNPNLDDLETSQGASLQPVDASL